MKTKMLLGIVLCLVSFLEIQNDVSGYLYRAVLNNSLPSELWYGQHSRQAEDFLIVSLNSRDKEDLNREIHNGDLLEMIDRISRFKPRLILTDFAMDFTDSTERAIEFSSPVGYTYYAFQRPSLSRQERTLRNLSLTKVQRFGSPVLPDLGLIRDIHAPILEVSAQAVMAGYANIDLDPSGSYRGYASHMNWINRSYPSIFPALAAFIDKDLRVTPSYHHDYLFPRDFSVGMLDYSDLSQASADSIAGKVVVLGRTDTKDYHALRGRGLTYGPLIIVKNTMDLLASKKVERVSGLFLILTNAAFFILGYFFLSLKSLSASLLYALGVLILCFCLFLVGLECPLLLSTFVYLGLAAYRFALSPPRASG